MSWRTKILFNAILVFFEYLKFVTGHFSGDADSWTSQLTDSTGPEVSSVKTHFNLWLTPYPQHSNLVKFVLNAGESFKWGRGIHRETEREIYMPFYFKSEVLLLFLHNSHGTPEFTNCGILAGED